MPEAEGHAIPLDEPPSGAHRLRQTTMAVLTEATVDELAQAEAAIGPLPGFRHLRRPETGLVMLRGRVGGAGPPFNVGEATVTRCFVVSEAGTEGAAYHLGRDPLKAEKAALFEALAREAPWRDRVEAALLAPVRERLASERKAQAAKAAATRVDFFTMVRGEDER
jgi:alpha-D-ribose 1-methylphosphonate 5-triphosphate synthase subunit PhnG